MISGRSIIVVVLSMALCAALTCCGVTPRASVATLSAACRGEDAAACLELGQRRLLGDEVSYDARAAALAFARACNLGLAKGCGAMGEAYWQGTGVARDVATARSLLTSACEDGEADSCVSLGALLRELDPNDKEAALRLYEQACDEGAGRGCLYAGLVYEETDDTAARAHARALFERGCGQANGGACAELGWRLEADDHTSNAWWANALPRYRRGCELGHGWSCARVGEIGLAEQGAGITAEAAWEQLRRACALDAVAGCASLGIALASSDPQAAAEPLRSACAGNHGASCTWLGVFSELGELGSVDPRHAAELYEKACTLGDAQGCANLGLAFLYGRGVEIDPHLAFRLTAATCEEQPAESNACENLQLFTAGSTLGTEVTLVDGGRDEPRPVGFVAPRQAWQLTLVVELTTGSWPFSLEAEFVGRPMPPSDPSAAGRVSLELVDLWSSDQSFLEGMRVGLQNGGASLAACELDYWPQGDYSVPDVATVSVMPLLFVPHFPAAPLSAGAQWREVRLGWSNSGLMVLQSDVDLEAFDGTVATLGRRMHLRVLSPPDQAPAELVDVRLVDRVEIALESMLGLNGGGVAQIHTAGQTSEEPVVVRLSYAASPALD